MNNVELKLIWPHTPSMRACSIICNTTTLHLMVISVPNNTTHASWCNLMSGDSTTILVSPNTIVGIVWLSGPRLCGFVALLDRRQDFPSELKHHLCGIQTCLTTLAAYVCMFNHVRHNMLHLIVDESPPIRKDSQSAQIIEHHNGKPRWKLSRDEEKQRTPNHTTI